MEKIQLDVNHGHFLAKIGEKNYLIDSGSPQSYGHGTLEIGGLSFQLSPNDAVIEQVNDSQLFEGTVDGLIGMNILDKLSITLDMENSVMLVGEPLDAAQYEHEIPLQVTSVMGQSYVMLTLNGGVNAILDTGAWVSYASSDFIGDRPLVDQVKDYNPIMGEISTTLHNVDVNLGGAAFELGFAKMPQLLEMTLSMIGVQVVLGISCLPFKKFRLDFQSGRMKF